MKKINNIILTTFICILPLIVGVTTLLREPELISVMEARKNNTFAKFLKTGINKNISKNFENALADQMIFRDRFIELNAKLNYLAGVRVINNVFVNVREGFLVSLPINLDNNSAYVNKKDLDYVTHTLYKKRIPFLYVDLPRKSDAYRNYIPDYYFKNNNLKYASNLLNDKNYIDLTERLLNSGRENYYKTDHHLNMNGIYLAYDGIIGHINKNFFNIGLPRNKQDFEIHNYQAVFIGSDGRKATQSLVSKPDSIDIYTPKKNFNTDAYLYGSNKSVEIFQRKQIKKSDTYNSDYGVYIGGDTNLCINNSDSLTNKKLLLVGNSFDNALVPLLSMHFSQVCHFDYRKIENSMKGDIDNINPDLTILMYDYMAANEKDAYKIFKKLLE